jgi:hypothetical protein
MKDQDEVRAALFAKFMENAMRGDLDPDCVWTCAWQAATAAAQEKYYDAGYFNGESSYHIDLSNALENTKFSDLNEDKDWSIDDLAAYVEKLEAADEKYLGVIRELVERLNNLKLAVGNLTLDKDVAMHNQIYISETIALAAPLLGEK